MGPHVVSLLKKSLLRAGPTVALPRYITSLQKSVERGEHAQLLRSVGDHLDVYKKQWADRYEDWARVYGTSKVDRGKSVTYGAAALAFRSLSAKNIVSSESGYVDGANIKESYLYKMASDYARKRKLAKPGLPIKPIGGALPYAEMLDKQYKAETSFTEVVRFVTPKLAMFAEDLSLGMAPQPPDSDDPEFDNEQEVEDIALEELEAMMGEETEFVWGGYEKVASTYPPGADVDEYARANGYPNFDAAHAALGEGARWDTETDYTRKGVAAGKKAADVEMSDDVLII
jgi:hypothetical protein